MFVKGKLSITILPGGCLGLGASTNQTRKICVPTQVHIKNPDDPDDGNEIFDDDEGEIQSSLVFTKVFCSRDCTALLTQDGELFVAGN